MAKWENLKSCPSCGDTGKIHGSEIDGVCGACGWSAKAEKQAPAPLMPRGCPGCGGEVRMLPKLHRSEEKMAACSDCGRQPIEYARLGAVMTERDQFAAAALTGFVSTMTKDDPRKLFDSDIPKSGMVIAQVSYILADAMLAEREKGKDIKLHSVNLVETGKGCGEIHSCAGCRWETEKCESGNPCTFCTRSLKGHAKDNYEKGGKG